MPRIRSGCLQSTICRLKETVTLTQVIRFVKRVSVLSSLQLSVAPVTRFSADETAALSHVSPEREAAP
jgi:hypothetical protein